MNGNNHFLFGGASCLLASEILIKIRDAEQVSPSFFHKGYDTKLLIASVIGLGIIGAIFPDIDNPKSLFGKLTYPLSKWISKIGVVKGHKYENHRWVFHDAGFYAVTMIGLYFLDWLLPLLGFFIGVYSHLLLDSLNPAGIRLFGKYFCIGKVESNSKAAVYLTRFLTGIVLILFIGFFFGDLF